MARLIIGHVGDTFVNLWVRGERRYPFAFVEVFDARGSVAAVTLELEERHGYTGAIEIGKLKEQTRYTCQVLFGREKNPAAHNRFDFGHCTGQFETFPAPGKDKAFKFLLGSCNLHSLGVFSPSDTAFETLTTVAVAEEPAFMIHCGDQIYYDIPNFWKPPSIPEYRDTYVDAWGDSRATRNFLTHMPQYMILDDHEITDNFANDADTGRRGATPAQFLADATKVYREFVHIRQPNAFGRQALYYEFSHGKTQFFVVDTRTERYSSPSSGTPCIIGERQMEKLKDWLLQHEAAVKFVVTSVPFAGEVRNSDDKWNAPVFQPQRLELMEHLVHNEIGGTVFLTGDMHNSYYATLEIKGNGKSVLVHELMSSPINHIAKSSIEDYDTDSRFRDYGNLKIKSRIRKIYDAHSSAMLIGVDGREIHFEIFRTKAQRRNARRGQFSL